jgi:hypothetical protein
VTKKPVVLNLANEMLWYYQGNFGFEDKNPLTMGGMNFAGAYLAAYNIAKAKGLNVGADITFSYSDYALFESGKRNVVLQYLIAQRRTIAQQLNCTEQDVALSLGIQLRVDQANGDPIKNGGRYPLPTQQVLEDTYAIFGNAGFRDVLLTEVNIINANSTQRAHFFEDVMQVASKHGSPVLFESPLRMNDENNPKFFNSDFTKTPFYYQLLKALFAN